MLFGPVVNKHDLKDFGYVRSQRGTFISVQKPGFNQIVDNSCLEYCTVHVPYKFELKTRGWPTGPYEYIPSNRCRLLQKAWNAYRGIGCKSKQQEKSRQHRSILALSSKDPVAHPTVSMPIP